MRALSLAVALMTVATTARAQGRCVDYDARGNCLKRAPRKPARGTLVVKAGLQGWARDHTIYINGEPRGRAPARLRLKPGDYEVSVEGSTTVRLTIRRGARETYYPLRPQRGAAPGTPRARRGPTPGSEIARLVVRGTSGAMVFVDDQFVGPVPVDMQLAPGAYALSIRREGFATESSQIDIEPEQTLEIPAELEEQGALVVRTHRGAKANIAINGEVVSRTGNTRQVLDPGEYTLAVVFEDGARSDQTVVVAPGQTTAVRPGQPETAGEAGEMSQFRSRSYSAFQVGVGALFDDGTGFMSSILYAGSYRWVEAGIGLAFGSRDVEDEGSRDTTWGGRARLGANVLSLPRADRHRLSLVNPSVGLELLYNTQSGGGDVKGTFGGYVANTFHLNCSVNLRLQGGYGTAGAFVGVSAGLLTTSEAGCK